ncbi:MULTISPECIES: HAMP domain-containing sensor histidine kinase [unclassified Leifsonia]|uniref:HAMP domain-containing sensor histidine kinase n=1 Tax=unclassified Leifsonia TaxID=2663824 RepID=UPI0008A74346|nr:MULTISPECIES: HAMP domain-containing sensor histidine kinase [unclassified Leifsonia]SEH84519.1 two-component system, OmpR family, sensor histidine kinase BaeS [Leifsonia sp. CL154]SFL47127.1 two-component system, OmpR family, sensor histidine kinase BaeS [Leifsonia sp. CL147]
MLGTFAVSLIAVLVTGIVALQVVQTVAETQARQQLKAQATALVEARATGSHVAGARLAALGDRFAVVAADGTVTGAARASVGPSVVRQLQSGRTVSGTTTLGGKDAVLVGIPTADGGGVVGVRKVADIAAGNADLVRWLLIALAIGLAVATVAGVLLARLLGRPLTRLAGSARELAAGRRGVPIADEPVVEIEDIAQALRGLDSALSVSEDRQREFLLSVSHDIRTPLTAIRGYAEALADGLVAPEEVAQVGGTLAAESERLRRFLDDLLELARLEAEDFPLNPQRFDARETVERAVAAWAGAASRAGVVLRAEVPGEPVEVTADGMRLRQVVDALIENALRVTPEGAPIVVALEGSTGILLAVRDGGPGLTEEDAAVAFERGALHERYREVRAVGTGLGLSIARRLVARLGGTITVGAAPEGGAAFVVSLPSSYISPAER